MDKIVSGWNVVEVLEDTVTVVSVPERRYRAVLHVGPYGTWADVERTRGTRHGREVYSGPLAMLHTLEAKDTQGRIRKRLEGLFTKYDAGRLAELGHAYHGGHGGLCGAGCDLPVFVKYSL